MPIPVALEALFRIELALLALAWVEVFAKVLCLGLTRRVILVMGEIPAKESERLGGAWATVVSGPGVILGNGPQASVRSLRR